MATEYCTLGVGICLSPEAWAAWVQALLTVATFAISIILTARANARAEKSVAQAEERARLEREASQHREEIAAVRRAKALAIPLLGHIQDKKYQILEFQALYEQFPTTDMAKIKEVADVHPVIAAAISVSADLGPATEAFQLFANDLTILGKLIEALEEHTYLSGSVHGRADEELDYALTQLLADTERALKELQALFSH